MSRQKIERHNKWLGNSEISERLEFKKRRDRKERREILLLPLSVLSVLSVSIFEEEKMSESFFSAGLACVAFFRTAEIAKNPEKYFNYLSASSAFSAFLYFFPLFFKK